MARAQNAAVRLKHNRASDGAIPESDNLGLLNQPQVASTAEILPSVREQDGQSESPIARPHDDPVGGTPVTVGRI
jgi:hypothetical protein